MYWHEDFGQLKLEMPFGVMLREDNRWVILSKEFPWEDIDREYSRNFISNEGQAAIPSRLVFGALYIQSEEGYTDEQTRRNIQENPYLQYFCGFECYTIESPFDASMMTRLPGTSMTSIAMGFFAVNMECRSRLLFAPECDWALDYGFDLAELVIFPRLAEQSVIQ